MYAPIKTRKKKTLQMMNGVSFQAFKSKNFRTADGRLRIRIPRTGIMDAKKIMKPMTRTDHPKPIVGSSLLNMMGKIMPPVNCIVLEFKRPQQQSVF